MFVTPTFVVQTAKMRQFKISKTEEKTRLQEVYSCLNIVKVKKKELFASSIYGYLVNAI